MKHKLLLFILVLITGVTANAQKVSYGLTGRVGAFKTLVSSGRTEETDLGIGLQTALGGWAKIPISAKGNIQLTILQLGEIQNTGEVQVVNENRQPIADAKVRDQNLAVGLQVMYLYTLREKWCVGVGLGSKYEYFSENRVEKKYKGYLIRPNNSNSYRQDLTLHFPLESQYKLSERLALVGQVQYQFNNRIEATNSDYQEHDLGLSLGVNYTLK
ncbi:hypothetical protein H8S95_08970 [Pontibacter sp. KCTC 32443]|uniref:hypothetical protein n=1 Tax=Pontibacter TaxID=323449 RepID=UPI00164E599F|nr:MULTISPECIES: hypothetical protein [Pontibacter]MBC5774192.1 hypothetical protein [Pontibacter sp. KCTC 32443]